MCGDRRAGLLPELPASRAGKSQTGVPMHFRGLERGAEGAQLGPCALPLAGGRPQRPGWVGAPLSKLPGLGHLGLALPELLWGFMGTPWAVLMWGEQGQALRSDPLFPTLTPLVRLWGGFGEPSLS